jgi:uncharacterized protein (TIGR02147 family)
MSQNINIFEFEDYRVFLRTYLGSEANQAAGARKKLLVDTGISTSLLTQILSEAKQLSSEQAYEVALHLNFSEKETDFFLNLVEIGRAGSVKLKERLRSKMALMRADSLKVSSRVSGSVTLTDEEKALYYSNWIYSGIRNLIPTGQGKTIKDIALKLNLAENVVEKATQMLMDFDLLGKDDKGNFIYSRGYTHLDSNNPMIFRHHQNWRQKAIQQMDNYKENHLHYTCPMAVPVEAMAELRARLIEEIKNFSKSLKTAKSPTVSYCLNIDLFEY